MYQRLVLVLSLIEIVYSQLGHWTYISGSNDINSTYFYGIKGLASIKNQIPARSSFASFYVTQTKLFYVFGGETMSNKNMALLNDVWQYNLTSSSWVWINGAEIINSYAKVEERGKSGKDVYPSARKDMTFYFDQFSKLLYVFGGYGVIGMEFGVLNDFWMYSTQTNRWTWLQGSLLSKNEHGVYGSDKNSCNYYPGARTQGSMFYVLSDYSMYMFGGYGFGSKDHFSSEMGYLNDLWHHDIDKECWFHISGQTFPNSNGVYGRRYEPYTGYHPGGRFGSSGFYDFVNKTYYLFGGKGLGSLRKGALNDVWKYQFDDSNWVWLSGDTEPNSRSSRFDEFDELNFNDGIGGRYNMLTFIDFEQANFISFGGEGIDGNGIHDSLLNECWKMYTETGQWVRMYSHHEGNREGIYGKKNHPSFSIYPGARSNFGGFYDYNNQALYIFGGTGYGKEKGQRGLLNDLWRFDVYKIQQTIGETTTFNVKDLIITYDPTPIMKYVPSSIQSESISQTLGPALSKGSREKAAFNTYTVILMFLLDLMLITFSYSVLHVIYTKISRRYNIKRTKEGVLIK